ncbi:TrlF family ATPase, partial [Brevibacterium casei]
EILTITKEIRFSAELDSDSIGGFARSSMTPGKQALFALTLILNESQEPWPLLIDQPEDDLDSRSIYETIVPYLVERKKERQIIMVSHNANLVIGSDSEQVIVANRHGIDRKNDRERTFEYFTGPLEHSQPLNALSTTTLGRFGIREHACEILDGGQEAFEKRRNKYKF